MRCPFNRLPPVCKQMKPLILGTSEHELAEHRLHQARYAAAWLENGLALQICDVAECQHFDAPYDLTNRHGGLHRAFVTSMNLG